MKAKQASATAPTTQPTLTENAPVPTQQQRGKVPLMPAVTNMLAIAEYSHHLGEIDGAELLTALTEETKKVRDGDLGGIEAALFGQATTLQAIFVSLAMKGNSQEYLKQWEAFMRMALKAQNQCRMTLETLAAIKNPPVIYARQANISNGPQQVNNNNMGPAAPEVLIPSPAANLTNLQTRVLEVTDGQWLDTGATRAPIGADQGLATMGEVDGSAERRW